MTNRRQGKVPTSETSEKAPIDSLRRRRKRRRDRRQASPEEKLAHPEVDEATGFRVTRLPVAGPPKPKKKRVAPYLLAQYRSRALDRSLRGENLDEIARSFGERPSVVKKWLSQEAADRLNQAKTSHREAHLRLADGIRAIERRLKTKRVTRFAQAKPDRLALASWLATAQDLLAAASRTAHIDGSEQRSLDESRYALERHAAALDDLLEPYRGY